MLSTPRYTVRGVTVQISNSENNSAQRPQASTEAGQLRESDLSAPARDGEGALGVHDRLRNAILHGDLAAGARMSQLALTDRFRVGRTPLREALRMLQREGLVVSEPNARVEIAPLSSSEAEDLFIMRIALEVVALRLTVPTLTPAQVGQLEGLMAQMDHFHRTNNHAAIVGPHRAFHERLGEGAGPRGLVTIAELFDHAERYRLAFGGGYTPESWPERHREHRAILDAAASGIVDRAAVALAGHLARTALKIFERLEPERDLSRLKTALASVAPGSETSLDD